MPPSLSACAPAFSIVGRGAQRVGSAARNSHWRHDDPAAALSVPRCQSGPMLRVAVIGSGPAGVYSAAALVGRGGVGDVARDSFRESRPSKGGCMTSFWIRCVLVGFLVLALGVFIWRLRSDTHYPPADDEHF